MTLGTTVDEVESPAAGDDRVHGVPAARYGRIEVTEADRETLDELDAALADLVHG